MTDVVPLSSPALGVSERLIKIINYLVVYIYRGRGSRVGCLWVFINNFRFATNARSEWDRVKVFV